MNTKGAERMSTKKARRTKQEATAYPVLLKLTKAEADALDARCQRERVTVDEAAAAGIRAMLNADPEPWANARGA